MKRILSLLLILSLIFAFCACGKNTEDVTDTATETESQSASEAEMSATQETPSAAADTTDTSEVETDASATQSASSADIPALEEYTLVAENTKNKNNFAFAGEPAATQTCNKIVMVNEDGATELAVSFAEDGSALTVYNLSADGKKYTTLAEFDEQGRLTGVFNGSGAYTTYVYGENNCTMELFDAQNILQDKRVYYYTQDGRTERVERSDATGNIETYHYTFLPDGQTASLRIENETGYILYEYKYYEDDMLESVRIEQNDLFFGLQEYTYDNRGNRKTYTIRNDETTATIYDKTVNYNNTYAEDGTYLGTAEVDSVTGEVYIAVAYGYTTTDYPHYAEFIKTHFATY